MILEAIRNKRTCGGDQQEINTGKKGCLNDLSSLKHFIAITKGTKFLKSTDLNLAYITEQVAKNKWRPVLGASSFEELTSEEGYNTTVSNVKRQNVEALPEFRMMYEEGHEFYKQLSKLKSFKAYDFIIIDDQGTWAIATDSNGDYQGFTMGHVTPEIVKRKVDGDTNESKSLVFQFIDRKQYDENYDLFRADKLGFQPEDIPSINGIVAVPSAIPSATDTSITFDLFLASDMETRVEGLDQNTDWEVLVNDVDNPITGVVENSEGNYTVTFTNALVAADDFEMNSAHATYGTNVAQVGSDLYRLKTYVALAIS